MKRMMIYMVCALFLVAFAGSAHAVEKKEKKVAQKTVTNKKAPAKAAQTPQAAKVKQVEKKYDDFIDKNKNGIDDRKERAPKKTAGSKKAADEKGKK